MILIGITQNIESQNGGYKKTKHVKFSEKRTFVTLWYATARKKCSLCVSGSKKCSFFGKFGVLRLLVTAVLRSSFCLIRNDYSETTLLRSFYRESVSDKFCLHAFQKSFSDTTKKFENKNLKPSASVSLCLSVSVSLPLPPSLSLSLPPWKDIQKLKGTWSFLFFLIQVLSDTPFYLSKLKFCTCAKHYFSNDLERIKR